MHRVLFVSKPIAPPYHDGTKCLVRDIALNLTKLKPVVMGARGAPDFASTWPSGAHVETWQAYGESGGFSPGLKQNLWASWQLLRNARAPLWHFVFAPNPKSSAAAMVLKRLKGVKMVQTVASPPRTFDRIKNLLFGDVVVAQSSWTKQRIEAAYREQSVPARRVEVIVPPVPSLSAPKREQQANLRQSLGIDEGAPLFVYPGDLELGRGAERVAFIVESLKAALPGVVVVFAYRAKTERAAGVAAKLERELDPMHVRVVSELDNILHLIASATAVLFPVEDLWGKVDLPIVVLESMTLGVPVVAPTTGPLSELQGVVKVAVDEPAELARAACKLWHDSEHRRQVKSAQLSYVDSTHRASRVSARYQELYLELLATHQ